MMKENQLTLKASKKLTIFLGGGNQIGGKVFRKLLENDEN